MNEAYLFAFSSADVYPIKVLLNEKLLLSCKLDKRIIPIHVQLNPTNRCNFNCVFCSCSTRDRTLELSLSDIKFCMRTFRDLGCESVTITGGGEPLLHPNFNEMIEYIQGLGIEIGLVTNGVYLPSVSKDVLSKIVWCRISSSDYLPQELEKNHSSFSKWLFHIKNVVSQNRVDWAFSHVVTSLTNPHLIGDIVECANEYGFTHVRLVNDIFVADQLSSKMDEVRLWLKQEGINDEKVNYQSRDVWVKGSDPCYISLLKPVVGADGFIYPCCGSQYALVEPNRDYEKTMRIAHIKDLEKLYGEQRCFDGSNCMKCYYSNYNLVLSAMLDGVKHEKFV